MAAAETAEQAHVDRSVTDIEATTAEPWSDEVMAMALLALPLVVTAVMPGWPVRGLIASET
jgi:hypothetical protein